MMSTQDEAFKKWLASITPKGTPSEESDGFWMELRDYQARRG